MKKIYGQIEKLYEKVAKSFLYLLKLDESSRRKLLNRFPPKFSSVKADHCTYYFGSDGDFDMPQINEVKVVGYDSDEYLEAAVCEVDGKLKSPDGRVFHITLSLDSKHRQSKDSNKLLAKGTWKKVTPFNLSVFYKKQTM